MRYGVCISTCEDYQIIKQDIKLVKVVDPQVLLYEIIKLIAKMNKDDHEKYAWTRVGGEWEKNNNPNSKDRGSFKIYKAPLRGDYYICYYKQIRDSDVITIKMEV